LSTFKIGNRSLSEVIRYFLSKGFVVSVPFGDGGDYDLIVDDGISLLKVEVKTGKLFVKITKSIVIFNTFSHQKLKEVDCRERADVFAVFCPQTGEVYLVPSNKAATGKGTIVI
jgi:hypothetical protein